MEDDYDLIFKVVLIGDSGVGKSNILSRYLKNEFSIETKTTVGVEFGAKKLEIKGTKIKAQIWDTAGQERYKSITNAYYKGSKGALLVYDVTRKESFDNVDKWIVELRKNAEQNVTIILIGNKCDLSEERRVTQEEAQEKANQFGKFLINNLTGIAFLETSAFQSINIDKAFNIMIEEIHKKYEKIFEDGDDEELGDSNNIMIGQAKIEEKQNAKKKCC